MIADRKIILEQSSQMNPASTRIDRVSSMLNRTSHQIDSEGFHGLNATSTQSLGSKQVTHQEAMELRQNFDSKACL